MDFIIEKVIDAVLEVPGIKETVGRNQQIIRLLQRFNLDDPLSLNSFEDVYAYTLVAYAFDDAGRCKPKPLVQFFKTKEVQNLFEEAYRQNDPREWLQKGEEIAQFRLSDQLPGLDPKRELASFAAVFVQVVKETQSPKEIRQEQKLESMGRQLQSLQSQIRQLPTLEAINQQINLLAGSETPALPAGAQTSNAAGLAHQLGEWFEGNDSLPPWLNRCNP